MSAAPGRPKQAQPPRGAGAVLGDLGVAMTLLAVDGLEMRFGERLIQTGVSFKVEKGTIFAIMGGSGCGKSTLLKHLIGLLPPAAGTVTYNGVDYWAADDDEQAKLRAGFGMLFQSAALWSSMTILENVCLPLEQHTKEMDAAQREARAREVLEWVDLAKFADFFPSDLSGGMKKRAGLARDRDRAAAAVPRRTLGRPGPDQLEAARRPGARHPRAHRRARRVRQPRAAEPVRDRRRRHLSRRRQQGSDRARQPARAARHGHAPDRAAFLMREEPPEARTIRIHVVRRFRPAMKRNALLIGAFVLAALAMIVVGVLWLSGNTLFKKQQEAMIFYQGQRLGPVRGRARHVPRRRGRPGRGDRHPG